MTGAGGLTTAGDDPGEAAEAASLIARLRAGDPDACRLIDIRYTRRLILLARARLPKSLAAKVAPEDVVQSVLRTFFARVGRGEFGALDDPEGCWRVLALITRRKCGRQAQYHHARKRDAARERDVSAAWEAVAKGPSPEEAAVLIETVEALGRDLEPHQVRMLDLLLDGRANAEIAAALGCSRRTVERFRDRLGRLLQRMLDGDGDDAPEED